ncbi:hypothetical protein [Arthrobacter sp. ISL-30]|nr:hypothetical protein [Arthrobacter sp. ISL-30]
MGTPDPGAVSLAMIFTVMGPHLAGSQPAATESPYAAQAVGAQP